MCLNPNSPPETCSRWYAFWCIGAGTESIMFSLVVFVLRDTLFQFLEIAPVVLIVLLILYALFALSYAIAGTLLICGMRKDSATMFKIGKILSYPFAIVGSIYVVIPIVHVLAVLKLSQYSRSRWN